jgi:hypothetical protein
MASTDVCFRKDPRATDRRRKRRARSSIKRARTCMAESWWRRRLQLRRCWYGASASKTRTAAAAGLGFPFQNRRCCFSEPVEMRQRQTLPSVMGGQCRLLRPSRELSAADGFGLKCFGFSSLTSLTLRGCGHPARLVSLCGTLRCGFLNHRNIERKPIQLRAGARPWNAVTLIDGATGLIRFIQGK